MKKLILLITLIICMFLTGCAAKVVDIQVDDIYGCVENFDITKYTCKIIYSVNAEETVNLSLDMLSKEDQNKLNQIGEHDITIQIGGFKKQIKIVLDERKVIEIVPSSNLVTAIEKEFDYSMLKLDLKYNDGTIETIDFSEDFLSSADIVSLKKAGTYDITIDYEEVSTIVRFEILPDEIAIEKLDKDVIVYCITKKVDNKYESKFFVLANKGFAGMQFMLNINARVSEYSYLNVNDKIFINKENNAINFVSSKNETGEIELFTISFTSSQQYRNFTINYDLDTKVVVINNDKVEETNNYLFTFTR